MTIAVAALVGIAVLSVALAGRSSARFLVRARATAPASGARRRRAPEVHPLLIPVGMGLLGLLMWGPVGGIVGVAVALLVRRLGSLRSRRALSGVRDEQLAEAVGALTSAVRAGLSLPQAFSYAAAEAEPPIRDGLEDLVAAIDAGTPVAEAITAWAGGIGTDDARLLASVLELHRRSGGDLPVVLDQVAATIRDRVAAAREVRALTAQARLSGTILGVLPIGFFAFLWVTSRSDIEGALATTAGLASVAVGLILEVTAFVWIRHLLEVSG